MSEEPTQGADAHHHIVALLDDVDEPVGQRHVDGDGGVEALELDQSGGELELAERHRRVHAEGALGL